MKETRIKKCKAGMIAAVLVVLTLFSMLPTAAADTTSYGTVTLSGGYQAGHFTDVWDLTAGDITLSFTYDGNGLVDDAGAHAWAELGVRSLFATKTVTLYADQDIAVGTVEVTRTGDTLQVTYLLTEPGWVITLTHLAVVDDPANFPLTKQGNPKVGQFEYSVAHYPAVTSYEYPPIDVSGLGDPLYIAAHACVQRPIDGCWEPVWQIGDVETSQMDNPCDGTFWDPFPASYYPPFPVIDNPFVIGISDNDDFPWITHPPTASQPFAYDYDINWFGALPFGGRVVLTWAPGKSSTDIVDIYLDEGATPILA